MPPAPRPLALALLSALVGVGVPLAVVPTGCGTDAVGIEACRQIESTRCSAALACGFTQDQADACTSFYRDQCLVGIENDTKPPEDAAIKACVNAVNATRDCANALAASMADCPAAPLVATTDASKVTPCDIITGGAELLQACAFVVKPPAVDAGTTTVDAADTSDAGDAGDAG